MPFLVSGSWTGFNLDRISTKIPGSRLRLGDRIHQTRPERLELPTF